MSLPSENPFNAAGIAFPSTKACLKRNVKSPQQVVLHRQEVFARLPSNDCLRSSSWVHLPFFTVGSPTVHTESDTVLYYSTVHCAVTTITCARRHVKESFSIFWPISNLFAPKKRKTFPHYVFLLVLLQRVSAFQASIPSPRNCSQE